MKTAIRAISFVAVAAALHAGFGSVIIAFFNSTVTKYPEPLRERWLDFLFLEAAVALAVMILCYYAAKRIVMR